MPDINNTEKLRLWLRACPVVAKSNTFGADYLGENATEYAVMSVPSNLRYRENILGERTLLEKQEQNFIFAAKIPYGSDIRQNLANLGFFQDVADWIKQQNEAKNFPEWNDGPIVGIEVTNSSAPVQYGADAARYQIQLKVTYRTKE